LSNPYAFDLVVRGTTRTIEAMRPAGEIDPPGGILAASTVAGGKQNSIVLLLSRGMLNDFPDAIATEQSSIFGYTDEWAVPLREKLDRAAHAIPGLQEDAGQRIDAALRRVLPDV
jgi:hypothetical protein